MAHQVGLAVMPDGGQTSPATTCARDRSRSRSRSATLVNASSCSDKSTTAPSSPTRSDDGRFVQSSENVTICTRASHDVNFDDIKFGPAAFDFSAPEPIPRAAQERVQQLLMSGRLFRYQGGVDDVAELEREFCKYIGLPYTMACNSGGCGLFLALKALGVTPDDKVLLNAWTLAPVPGAIVHAGATPVFVNSVHDTLTIDLKDLEAKAIMSGAKILLLSYMRGQVPNMDHLMDVVTRLGITLIEDCAHTLGGQWKLKGTDHYKHIGTFGAIGVWSLQTNKSINSGEGGLISTSRQDIASYITIASGSYGHYGMNGASGDTSATQDVYSSVPNMSMRMTTIAAALARPQLEGLPLRLNSWARHAFILRRIFKACPHIRCLNQDSAMRGTEVVVWSSIQFELIGFSENMVEQAINKLAGVGVPLAWFGGPCKGFTSTLRDWKFADPSGEQWKDTIAVVVKSLVDLPLYHTARWSDTVIEKLGTIVVGMVTCVAGQNERYFGSRELEQC